MSSDITLTGAQRSALLTLQNVADLSDRTQNRLTTGKKVNSVVDNAVAFFQSKSLNDRAADFTDRKDGIDQGISSITAALGGLEQLDQLLKQMKGVAEASKTQTTTERASATTQFQELGNQISLLIEDASYQGLNLLNNTGSQLDVAFSTRTSSRLQVDGFDLNATSVTATGTRSLFTGINTVNAAGGFDASLDFVGISALSGTGLASTDAMTFSNFNQIGTNNSYIGAVDQIITNLDSAISRVRATSAELGTNVAILQTRLDFTNEYVNTLQGGSDKLTLADLNEEGANLVALQTRQQLGIQSLSIAGQQQQAILALLN
ncbi:MAG: flagellin [Rhodospirillaceae bacterium]|jgi:flagellin-like hook-associated protein FlgL|uniref:flagellin N-terminal helical domain-containing protein n=1 Tax=unclassified Hwanghaeella TaxID=2605944 RepID=UPI000C46E583|nr:flagellin [Rhodospirillales bacterium]MAX48096.1 flagellin [Rhodospirillaceae bacterium]|tara:strand:+ start:94339 stop:95298 length:960 start_codon:yes stop_codon:yes gene_type:complete